MLDPDKIGLAVLYYLHAADSPEGDAKGISAAIGSSVTEGAVAAQLDRLFDLGLVVGTGPMPIGISGDQISTPEWWGITHEGAKYIHSLLQQPRSFIARLHKGGFAWLNNPDAAKAQVSTKLTKVDVYDAVNRPAASAHAIAPQANSVEPSIDWTKWGTIIGALALLVTLVIAVLS